MLNYKEKILNANKDNIKEILLEIISTLTIDEQRQIYGDKEVEKKIDELIPTSDNEIDNIYIRHKKE